MALVSADADDQHPPTPSRPPQAGVLDVTIFRPRGESSRAEVLAAASRMMPLLLGMEGFVSRELAIGDDGRWLDLMRWAAHRDALSAVDALPATEVYRDFAALMDPGQRQSWQLRCELTDLDARGVGRFVLRTPRLQLRPAAPADAAALHAIWAARGLDAVRGDGAVPCWARVRAALAAPGRTGSPALLWIGSFPGDERPAAFGGFWQDPGDRDDRVLMILDPAAEGRGIATEFGRALLDWAWGPLGLQQLTASADADEPAYPAVLEKLGFWFFEERREGDALIRRYRTTRAHHQLVGGYAAAQGGR